MTIQCPYCDEEITLEPDKLFDKFTCPYCGLIGIIEIDSHDPEESDNVNS